MSRDHDIHVMSHQINHVKSKFISDEQYPYPLTILKANEIDYTLTILARGLKAK